MKKVFFVCDHSHPSIEDHSAAIIYWYGILDKMGYDVRYEDYSSYDADEFYKKVKEEKPFMVIFTNYFRTIHIEFARFRDIAKVYLLQGDMHRFYDEHVKLWIPFVDGIINFEGTKEWCLRDGLPENGFLKMKWGFNPNTMCYPQVPKTREISFYGSLHSNRSQIISSLSKHIPVDVVPSTATYEQVKHVLAESTFSLNLSMNAPLTRRELKGRVIEIPAHCILLSEPAPELEDYYDEDEYIMFTSIDEAVDKIKSLTPQDIESIFKKSNRALWNKNTAFHEWNKILPLMDPDYKPIDVNKLIKENYSEYIYG
jgi:hypothetical protein